MSLDSDNVRVAVTGAIYVGTSDSPAPTTAESALDASFADLGYVGEDGVTETRDRSTNSITGWQNGDLLREVVTESSLTYEFMMAETKKETVELYYGTTVDTTDGSIVVVPSKTGGRKPYVLDVIDDEDFIRTYIPSGEISEVGEQVYANGEVIGYMVIVKAYVTPAIQDEDGNNGAAVKWYSALVES